MRPPGLQSFNTEVTAMVRALRVEGLIVTEYTEQFPGGGFCNRPPKTPPSPTVSSGKPSSELIGPASRRRTSGAARRKRKIPGRRGARGTSGQRPAHYGEVLKRGIHGRGASCLRGGRPWAGSPYLRRELRKRPTGGLGKLAVSLSNLCVQFSGAPQQCLSPVGMFRHPVERLLGDLCSELAYSRIEAIIAAGLHEHLDRLQNKLNQVGNGISETFFAARGAPPVRKKSGRRTAPQFVG